MTPTLSVSGVFPKASLLSTTRSEINLFANPPTCISLRGIVGTPSNFSADISKKKMPLSVSTYILPADATSLRALLNAVAGLLDGINCLNVQLVPSVEPAGKASSLPAAATGTSDNKPVVVEGQPRPAGESGLSAFG